MSLKFDPDGFSQKALTGEEAARHRAMLHRLEREWFPISEDHADLITAFGDIVSGMTLLIKIARIAIPTFVITFIVGMGSKLLGGF